MITRFLDYIESMRIDHFLCFLERIFYFWRTFQRKKLCKEICIKCVNFHHSESTFHGGRLRWDFKNEQAWKTSGRVDCPKSNFYDTNNRNPPPEKCEYALEHIMEMGE